MRLYVDGEKVAAITANDWGSTVGVRADICGGNDQNITGKFYMDNLIIWNNAKTAFSDRFYEAPTIVVPIDIKPGSCPNSINLKSKGVVPVAVLTANGFDASTVAPETVEFAGALPKRWTLEDADGDGDEDMLFHFRTQELNLTESSTEATLTGETLDEVRTKGTDTVNIVPQKKGQ